MSRSLAALAALALMGQAPPPKVSEDIHDDVSGDIHLCDFVARDMNDLRVKVRATNGFAEHGSDDGFEVWVREKPFVQFVIAQPAQYGFPMATCRMVIEKPDGTASLRRMMRCDGSREDCDRIFLQFEDLDKEITAGK